MRKKDNNKNSFISGFINNVSIFILIIILYGIQLLVYNVYFDDSFSCGSGAMQFGYTEGFLHVFLALVLFLLFIVMIFFSIYNIFHNRKKKKLVERYMNIIFLIINIVVIIVLPLNIFILDLKYGNNVPEYDTSKFECINGMLRPIEEE